MRGNVFANVLIFIQTGGSVELLYRDPATLDVGGRV